MARKGSSRCARATGTIGRPPNADGTRRADSCSCIGKRPGAQGFYRLRPLEACSACPQFATCGACRPVGPVADAVTLLHAEGGEARPVPMAGYWIPDDITLGALVVPCLPQTSCPGGALSVCAVRRAQRRRPRNDA